MPGADTGALRHPVRASEGLARRGWDAVLGQVGGPARLKVIVILASVVALSGADTGTISATASNLENVFHIANTEVGLLVTVSTLTGAIFTIPFGALTDRVNRTNLIAVSVLFWAGAMFFSGASQSFIWLVISRVALGAVVATAGPAVASLTGDFFPARDRARMYGFILAGELVGTGIGFVISGDVAAGTTWRYAFWWLMLPSAALSYVLFRTPEPARGGQSRIAEGDEEITGTEDVTAETEQERRREEREALEEGREGVVQVIEEQQIAPYENQILHEDPARKGLGWAVRYVLRVRTDVVIIVASALGYFYFQGLRTFAILWAQHHFGISKSLASSLVLVVGLGALVGVFLGGRAPDWLLKRGRANARVIVPVVVLFMIPLFLAPALAVAELWIAVPLLVIGGALLGAGNPPMDAARLDIIHPHLWGRSEGVRSALRSALEAAAPLAFGYVSDSWFGGHVHYGATATSSGHGSSALSYTFLLFLVVVIAAACCALVALRTYPRDVATADASVRNTLGRAAKGRDYGRAQPARVSRVGDDGVTATGT